MSNERDVNLNNTEREHNCCHTEGHDHDHSCEGHDCCHDHEHHQTIAIEFDDGTELDCPVIDIFEVSDKEYIALIHPVEQSVLIYRFLDNEDGTVSLTSIEDDAENKVVTETFMALLKEES